MNQDRETHLKLHISLYVPNRIYNNAVMAPIPLMDYEDATLARKQNFDLINKDQLQVIDYRITTRRVDAAEATRCSCACSSSAVQLRGRPPHQSLSRGSSLCSRCSTSDVSHMFREEALRLRTARSARSRRHERG